MEPDSPDAPQDFCIHHWAEEMVLRTELIKFTDSYQRILWFSKTVGSQVSFKGARGSTGFAGHRREELVLVESTFSTICNHPEVDALRGKCVLEVPVVENGTLPNNNTHLLPCVRGLHLSLINSFMQWLKQTGIEFLILSLSNKMPDTRNAWHHIRHSQWQMKGVTFCYYKICDVKICCLS